jgi:hypothetical protein
LNTTLTPHSIIHGDACFAYFNKIWGIPRTVAEEAGEPGNAGTTGTEGLKEISLKNRKDRLQREPRLVARAPTARLVQMHYVM